MITVESWKCINLVVTSSLVTIKSDGAKSGNLGGQVGSSDKKCFS